MRWRCSRRRRTGSPAPCPYAGPGLCGGCDFQHVTLREQRGLKARGGARAAAPAGAAGRDVVVEPVPGDRDGLGWRTRSATSAARRAAGHAQAPVARAWSWWTLPDRHPEAASRPRTVGVVEVRRRAQFAVADDGFWQVHPGAPRALVEAVLDARARSRGSRRSTSTPASACSAGSCPTRSGRPGRVFAVEGDRGAAGSPGATRAPGLRATTGSTALCWRRVRRAVRCRRTRPAPCGREAQVVGQVVEHAPRAVAYVACDPAALARDIGDFAEARLRADRPARLRPVPDDAPRRVRGASCEKRLWPAVM